jgi:hypothetical protein
VQVLLALVGAGADDLAVAQLELHAADVDARRARRDGEADAARGARLDRAREDLAGRHVAPPSELTHVRPPTSSVRSVPSASSDSDGKRDRTRPSDLSDHGSRSGRRIGALVVQSA